MIFESGLLRANLGVCWYSLEENNLKELKFLLHTEVASGNLGPRLSTQYVVVVLCKKQSKT